LDCRQYSIFKITTYFRAFEFSLTPSHWSDVWLQVLLASLTPLAPPSGLLSAASVQNTVNIQWVPAHVGKEGNDLADSEAKRGSTLPQPAASLDYITASATLVTNQHAITATRYDSGLHTLVHRVFADMEHPHRCWPRNWTRDQCVTVAQLHTGHSPLLAAYLHCIGRRDSATCPHCNGADETAEHLVLHCPAHDQARRESWPNLHDQSNPRRLWSFLEKIGAVTRPPTGNERERERGHSVV